MVCHSGILTEAVRCLQAGVNADALSHEDYLQAAGDSVTTKFTVAGTYGYYCQPHQGSMAGKVIVK